MSVMLIALSMFLIRNFDKPIRQTDKNLYAGGIASGFLAGLIGTGGAVRGITLAAFNLPKDIFIATSGLIDLGVDSTRALVYWMNGYVSEPNVAVIMAQLLTLTMRWVHCFLSYLLRLSEVYLPLLMLTSLCYQ